jgi:hypothetical protein
MTGFRPIAVLALALVIAGAAQASPKTDCKLKFSMAGWSVLYKTASGSGTITCDNGQKMNVLLKAKGGGLSVGKSKITNGTGEFSEVSNIKDLLGSYASGEAHAGAAKSSKAEAMTKGDVSLALAGTGEGWDLGITFGSFTISAAK